MHLFKRLLLTKFPNSTIHNTVHPASMFIGLISSKEFFSIINRKITENNKLNLFDVNIDPVEFKMGFWESSNTQNPKDLESYFAYCAAANLNGPLFFSPANLANGIAMLASLYLRDAMDSYPKHCLVQLVYTVFLLSFTFSARIKVFPYQEEQKNYNRFIDLFFNFYKITFEQLGTKISKEELQDIKKSLLRESSFFFLLYHFYKKLNEVLKTNASSDDFLDRMLGMGNHDKLIKAFKSNYATTSSLSHTSPIEQSVLSLVWPADILIKYLFGDADPFVAIDTIVNRIFDKTELDPLVQSFLSWDKQLPVLFSYLLDYKKYKHGFFAGVQNYIIKLFRNEGKDELLEDIDEMLSAIDNGEDISNFDVPERIKKESKITERLLNFYVTLLGGFTTARGDSFYIRFFFSELVDFFTDIPSTTLLIPDNNLYYYGHILFQYSKNLYYYSYIGDNVRAGKSKFSIPVKGKTEKAISNFSVLQLYNQGMLASFFQDLNPKDTRITIKNNQITKLFKEKFWSNISSWLKLSSQDFLKAYYQPLLAQLPKKKDFTPLLYTLLREENKKTLKDSLYKLDYRVSHTLFERLQKTKLTKHYDPVVVLAIFGTIRETFFGMVALQAFLKNSKMKGKKDFIDLLWIFYFKDILTISVAKLEPLLEIFISVAEEFEPIFNIWIELDDNPDFFKFILKNSNKFMKGKQPCDLLTSLTGEDMVWFRGLLKNITYYNKRFVIPG